MPVTVTTPLSVTIITATTGNALLDKCLESVQGQTFARVEHVVVIDGPEHGEKAEAIIGKCGRSRPLHVIRLPCPTGKNRYHGHRIYGATPFLCDGDFVAFLDEDNWFEPDHIESLIEIINERQLHWAYSLRKITDRNGDVITTDDCESLGRWPVWNNPNDHLVDTSCYMIRRDIAIRFSWVWNRRARPPGVRDADRELCRLLMKHAGNFDTTGKYTLNYRVGSNPYSVNEDFFIRGNSIMSKKYPNGFPWQRREDKG